ncbi:EamA family transporter [Actinocorallia sp. A-T 12471]|uniref:EamA family transporter n=1 Tax=Actinocorallia sp. A-T 12471 TaxID=3089813 RepID=UPI0029CD898C|nr:EamA family transporter [Actinocorallia sp. A-T 12471]MDX6739636.1 EamA family transporter [Actinocorallia sp. A-T 12471]
MPSRHRALAVAVAAIWGVNFVVIDLGLREVPPLVLTALRFLACAVPLVFLVPRPTSRLRHVVAYGLALGVVKFGLLFTAMAHGMPAGLASLVIQAQALFSVALAALALGERVRSAQAAGVAVASGGIALLALGRGEHAPLAGLLLTVGAALAWACANIVVRLSGERRPLSLLAYSSLVPPLPLLAIAGAQDGLAATVRALTHLSWTALLAVAFISYASTLLGFGVWNRLLAEHGVAKVAPYGLLVPVFGLGAAAVVLGEPVTPAVATAAAVVLFGLFLVGRPVRVSPGLPAGSTATGR